MKTINTFYFGENSSFSKKGMSLSALLLLFVFQLNTVLAQAPSTILPDIINFKLEFPLDAFGNDYTGVAYADRDNPLIQNHIETNLGGYVAPSPYSDYFYVSGNEVVFKAHCAGALTSANSYPRCELRQRIGGADTFWEYSDEQELNATFRVTNLPDLKQEVCILQAKGNTTLSTSGTDEVLRLEYREGSSQLLHLVVNESTTLNNIMPYSLNDTMKAKIHVLDDSVTVDLLNVTTGDTYYLKYKSNYQYGYFKAGCYTQSSIWVEKNGVGDELPTAYGEVRFSELTLFTSSTASISDLESNEEQVHIFPNPANNSFKVDFDTEKYQQLKVSIYSLSGQLELNSGIVDSNDPMIDVQDFPKGLYIVRMQDEDSNLISTQKLIVD